MRLKARIPICEEMELEIETREHLNAVTGFEEMRNILNDVNDSGAKKMLAALPETGGLR